MSKKKMTMGGRLDYDKVATILVEAIYYGDTQTAERWDVSTKTIQRYRNRLDEDSELSSIVQYKKEAFETKWANELPAAIRSALRFIVRAGEVADPKNPDAIHAIAGALKIVAEVGLTKEIIDARLSRELGPAREANNAVASLTDGQVIDAQ